MVAMEMAATRLYRLLVPKREEEKIESLFLWVRVKRIPDEERK